MLQEILDRLNQLDPAERKQIEDEAFQATAHLKWVANPGPQLAAFHSPADELFYGGQAGGGKSSLACGLALTAHERSLILRRINKDAKKLAEAELLGKILGGQREGWNGTDLVYRDGTKVIEFGGCELERDKQRYKGDPHDLIVFDEVTDFLESQYVFITIWNRSATPGQRSRVVATGNPPTTAEGLWVIKRWAAWLDPKHPNPAKPGELRWYVRNQDDTEQEVAGPGEYDVGGAKLVAAKSRTFIPAALSDNPDLAASGEYQRILDGLPKELRDAYRDGKFEASVRDADFQVIPTAWIIAAQARWTPQPPTGLAMTVQALDPAGGGRDAMELASRYGGWFGELVTEQGASTADGSTSAATVVKCRRDNCPVVVDVGGGYGGAVMLRLKDNGIVATGFNGSNASTAKTKDGQLAFINKRAESWWRFRESLNPDQEGGSPIALPPCPELRADLAAPTWSLSPRGIQIESKDDLRVRLGRSPGKGDAVVMCLAEGDRAVLRAQATFRGQRPQVILGHSAQRRQR